MTPRLFLECGVKPAYTLLPAPMQSKRASAMILAIGLQESEFKHRRQMAGGPARGYTQFEMHGGILGVLKHPATKEHIRTVLAALNYDDDIVRSYLVIEHNDVLCAAYSRLLLWTDPHPLPDYGQDGRAWEYYLRTWRPGLPHADKWSDNYNAAWEIVGVGDESGDEDSS